MFEKHCDFPIFIGFVVFQQALFSYLKMITVGDISSLFVKREFSKLNNSNKF